MAGAIRSLPIRDDNGPATAPLAAPRPIVVVADSTYAVLELLDCCRRLSTPVTMGTRLRWDAALYDPAPPRRPGRRGAPRQKGARQPTLASRLTDPTPRWEALRVRWYGRGTRLVKIASGTAVWYHRGMPVVPLRWVLVLDPTRKFDPQALLSTDVELTACQMVEWLVWRWQLEVTLQEARAHLGIETQWQWSDLASLRTTPTLLGRFSLVTLLAHQVRQEQALPARSAAWYMKTVPTFSDTLAFVRQQLWPAELSWISPVEPNMVIIPQGLFERLTDTLAFAA